MLNQVSNFFSLSTPVVYRLKMGHKIKDIRHRLDGIAMDRRNFHFTEQIVDAQSENSLRESHSFVRESDVIGRDLDKKNIVKLLMSSCDDEGLAVIPVVGLGGLGKTTLAKLVYNHHNVIQNFEIRMWVSVSDDFDLKKLTEKVLKSATSYDCSHLDMDQLQTRLRLNVCAKRFILVLDDVWNNDLRKWSDFRNLLMGGVRGSKVIVTTRDATVASIMGTVPPYRLKGLSDDECLSLFMKCAFRNKGLEKEYQELVEIGKAIVRKCCGMPLAVQTLGSLLHMKTEEKEWQYIRDNEIWRIEQKENDILPVLRLSYNQMPADLKQCFAYSSIFPKDYDITKRELVSLWRAQGFIQSNDRKQHLDDIGIRLFKELLSRSFFQDVFRLFDNDIWKCKMHDLVHDLAQSVAGPEYAIINLDNNTEISEKVRHISFYDADLSSKDFPRVLLKAKKLRSFLLSYKVGPISKSFMNTLIGRFKCMRVLGLSGSEFEELPSSIGDLKHLRFIYLSHNRRLKALPNSICKLLNLQMLNLLGCDQLHGLPRDFGKLISLEHLYLTSQLTCLPENALEGLTSLRTSHLFQCSFLTTLSEGIQYLTTLHTLRIIECPRLSLLPSGMKHLTIEKLVIKDCQELDLSEGEGIQGLQCLRSAVIGGLPNLTSIPLGLQQAATTLKHLCIDDCPGLTTFPQWTANLTALQGLSVVSCPSLFSLPEGLDCLTKLRVLNIKGCPHLSESCRKDTGEYWPNISHIQDIYLNSRKI